MASRWQYAVADIGIFGALDRMARVLSFLGEQGYELVGVYDKADNLWTSFENGFLMFKREVAEGDAPDGPWCGVVDMDNLRIRVPKMDGLGPNGFPVGEAW